MFFGTLLNVPCTYSFGGVSEPFARAGPLEGRRARLINTSWVEGKSIGHDIGVDEVEVDRV